MKLLHFEIVWWCNMYLLSRLVQKTYISAAGCLFYFQSTILWGTRDFGAWPCLGQIYFSCSSVNVMLLSVFVSATERKPWATRDTAYQRLSQKLFPSFLFSILCSTQQRTPEEQGKPSRGFQPHFPGDFSQWVAVASDQRRGLFQVTFKRSSTNTFPSNVKLSLKYIKRSDEKNNRGGRKISSLKTIIKELF